MASSKEVEDFKAKCAAVGLEIPKCLLPAPQSSEVKATVEVTEALSGLLGATGRSGGVFEETPQNIPIEAFEYGEDDWDDWSENFESAVEAATNAQGRDRIEELCLLWISLKLSASAYRIFNRCENRGKDWSLLKKELATAFEDPSKKRRWARYLDAFKKPQDMPLPVYKAKVIQYVNRYNKAIVNDGEAYRMALYTRFVDGLEEDWRQYIEDSIPYGKEKLENAYSQALKYEAKLSKSGTLGALKVTEAKKKKLKRIQHDLDSLKAQVKKTGKVRSSKRREEDVSDSGDEESDSRDEESDQEDDESDQDESESNDDSLAQAMMALSVAMKELSRQLKRKQK